MSNVSNGKAFEYACLQSFYDFLSPLQEVIIEVSPHLNTAKNFFLASPDEFRSKLMLAANAASRVIIRLEPQLEHPSRNTPLYLSIQADAKGKVGDVRDVLCIRKQNNWQIGLSCKHNHHAVKHNRLSPTIDFGREWFGIPCSDVYFDAVTPLFEMLRTMRTQSNATALWSEVAKKNERVYIPILQAFIDEIKLIDSNNPLIIPERLIRYLIGKNDFYKVITNNVKKSTRVEAINIAGTLNRNSDGKQSLVNVARLKLPTRFFNIGFKPASTTTVEVVCDEGWSVSMRIHNASSQVEASLKFDVNLTSLPSSIHAQVEPW